MASCPQLFNAFALSRSLPFTARVFISLGCYYYPFTVKHIFSFLVFSYLRITLVIHATQSDSWTSVTFTVLILILPFILFSLTRRYFSQPPLSSHRFIFNPSKNHLHQQGLHYLRRPYLHLLLRLSHLRERNFQFTKIQEGQRFTPLQRLFSFTVTFCLITK